MRDFFIIVGRYKASVNAESVAGKRYLQRNFIDVNEGTLEISREAVDSVEKSLTDAGYVVETR